MSVFDGIERTVAPPSEKRWGDDVEPFTADDLRAVAARLINQQPQYRAPLYPPGWTMSEIGPLPPGWTVVDGKPVRP